MRTFSSTKTRVQIKPKTDKISSYDGHEARLINIA